MATKPSTYEKVVADSTSKFLSKSDFNDFYKNIGAMLNDKCKGYNFRVADTAPAGKPASINRDIREYRLQLINKNNDTSEVLKTALPKILQNEAMISDVKFNKLSPNSSKYSSVSFSYKLSIYTMKIDVVIAKGANKGEAFEKKVVSDLQSVFRRSGISDTYEHLIDRLTETNKDFDKNEIKKVYQRSGSTKKEGVPIERLNEVIGDVVLEDSVGKKWYISLKDVTGDTLSSYSGAASLMSPDGTLNPTSQGADFLRAFGADLNQIQSGYDLRKYPPDKMPARKKIPVTKAKPAVIKDMFERAWGMNYFYVRRIEQTLWKVFWLNKDRLNKLSSSMYVGKITYPTKTSKQITIYCSNQYADYIIEVRNSKGGEYPNDIKFKVKYLHPRVMV